MVGFYFFYILGYAFEKGKPGVLPHYYSVTFGGAWLFVFQQLRRLFSKYRVLIPVRFFQRFSATPTLSPGEGFHVPDSVDFRGQDCDRIARIGAVHASFSQPRHPARIIPIYSSKSLHFDF